MSRRTLERYLGQRLRFTAAIDRYGWDSEDRSKRTACLVEPRIGSTVLAGHIWVDWHWETPLHGTVVEFTASVGRYRRRRIVGPRGKRGRKRAETVYDYKLVDLGDVRIVERRER